MLDSPSTGIILHNGMKPLPATGTKKHMHTSVRLMWRRRGAFIGAVRSNPFGRSPTVTHQLAAMGTNGLQRAVSIAYGTDKLHGLISFPAMGFACSMRR